MPSPELTYRVRAALDAGALLSTDFLAALLIETGGEKCYRRNRITHLLIQYLTRNSPLPMAPSTTHRFKEAFADRSFEIHDPETRSITALNLTDDDALYLLAHEGGHLIEPITAPISTDPADLARMKKVELIDLHAEIVGEPAPADATRAQLVEAIAAYTPDATTPEPTIYPAQ